MNKEKYVIAKAKILSKNENNYTIGFKCHDCESGYATTPYKYEGEGELSPGDLVDVNISNITVKDDKVTDIYLHNGETSADNMAELVKEAKEKGILKIQCDVERKDDSKYSVVEDLGNKMYRLQNTNSTDKFIGMAIEEIEVNTVADATAFERIAEEHEMSEYTLLHHWWDNGKFEHWDLFMNDGEVTTHMVLETDPLKTTEIKAVQRQPYSDDFWLKGENIETVAPGEPGNPSKEAECQVERLDSGKVAVYESAVQGDDSYLMRLEFFGTTLEGRWSFTSTVQNVWHALKETTKLTEVFPMPILLSGDIGSWKETDAGLEVTGTALSFGVWNGLYWSPEVIMNSPLNDFDNMIVDVEHDNDKVAGAILEKEVSGPDVNVKFLVTDYETQEKIKSGEYKGLSIDAKTFVDPVRRIIAKVKQYTRLTVCGNPACKVCYIN